MTDNYDDLYNKAWGSNDKPADAPAASNYDDLYESAWGGGSKASEGAEWGDYVKSGQAALYETGARLMTGAQRFADAYGTQSASEANRRSAVDLQRGADAVREGMSQGGRDIAEAQALPDANHRGLASVAYEHPIDTLGIKGAQLGASVAPYLVAGAVGGLPGEIAMGAADQTTSSMHAAVSASNAMTDDELKQQSPRFAQLLQENPDAYQARLKFRDELYSTPQLAADFIAGGALGWVTGRTLGTSKQVIKGAEKVAEKAGDEAQRSALRSMTEQAGANAVGGMMTDVAQQKSEAVTQGKEFTPDVGRTIQAGVNAGVEGALAAGAPHAYRAGVNKVFGAPKAPAPKVPEVGGDPAQTAALQATQQGVTAPIQPTQRQPVQQQPSQVTPAANPTPVNVQQEALNRAAQATRAQQPTPVTEPAPQIQAQAAEAQAGRKLGVVYPKGTGNIPEAPAEGLKRFTLKNGPDAGTVIDINADQLVRKSGKPYTSPLKRVEEMYYSGKLSEENGYGRYSQAEVAQTAAQKGEQTSVLQSQTPEGQPINDVASTPSLKPEQIASMEQTLPPGGSIVEKPVDQVLAEREGASRQAVRGYEDNAEDRLRGRIAYIQRQLEGGDLPDYVRQDYERRVHDLTSNAEARDEAIKDFSPERKVMILSGQPEDHISGVTAKGHEVSGTLSSYGRRGIYVHDNYGLDHIIPYDQVREIVHAGATTETSAPVIRPKKAQKAIDAGKKRPSFEEALAAHPDGWTIPSHDEGGHPNPEWLHLKNLYSKDPSIDLEGALTQLSREQRERAEKSGVAGYADPRTSDLLGGEDFTAAAPDVTPAAKSEPAKADAYVELQNRLAAVQDAWDPEVNANPPHSELLRRWERLAKNIAGDDAAYTHNPVNGFLMGKIGAAEARDKISRAGKHGQTATAQKLETAFNALVQHVLSRESHVKLSAGEAMRRDDAMFDLNRGIGPDSQPNPKTSEASDANVTSAAKTPQRSVPKGAGRKTAEVLGRVADGAPAKPEVAGRPLKAQEVLDRARGVTTAPVAVKTKRQAKPREEQKQGKASPHERRARADANRLGAEIAAKHKLPDALVTAAAKGDESAWKQVQAIAVKMVADFNAAAKKINDDHAAAHPDRTKLKATTYAKEQVKIPRQYAENLNAESAPTAGLAMVMEARTLIKDGKKGLQRFAARHDIAHKGDLTKFNEGIYADRQAEGKQFGDDQLNRAREAAMRKAGVEDGVTQDIRDDSANPEEQLIAKQEPDEKLEFDPDRLLKVLAEGVKDEKPAPKKPPVNTVMKESLAAEREKEVGEQREVDRKKFEEIAAAALANAKKKDTGVAPPPPKKAEPEPAKEDAASVWLRKRGEPTGDDMLAMETSKPLTSERASRIDNVMNGGTLKRAPNGQIVSVKSTAKARDIFKPSDFGRMWTSDPRDRVFMPMLWRRVLQVAGDTPVHVLADTRPNRDAMRTKNGGNVDGAFFPRSGEVYVFQGKNGQMSRHIVVHEVTHAATAKGIESNSKLRGDIRKLMDHVLDQVGNQGWFERPGDSNIRTIRDHYAFRNEAEFIAEFGGNHIFRETLRDVPVSPELAHELGMKNWHRATVYSAIIDRLRRFFRLPEKANSALEAALMLTERSMQETEHARRGGSDEMLALPSREEAVDTFKKARVGDHIKEQLGRFQRYVGFTNDVARKLDTLMGGGRVARDAASTLESRHALHNQFLKEHGGEQAVELSDKLRREYGDDYSRLVDLTYDARHAGVDIDSGMGQFNDGINQAKGRAWLEKHGAEIARLRDEHPDLWKGMREIRDTIDRFHTESAVGSIKTLLDYYKLEGADHERLARRFYNDTLSEKDKALLGIGDETKAEQKEISELLNAMHGLRVKYRKEAGTYAPFFREGSHWVAAKRAVNFVGSGELTSNGEVHFEQRKGESPAELRERVEEFVSQAVKEHDYDLGKIYGGVLDPSDPHGPLLEREQEGPEAYRVPLKLDYAAKVDGEVAGRQHLEELKADNTYTVGDKTFYRYDPNSITEPYVQASSDFTSSGGGALAPRLDALRNRLMGQQEFQMKPEAEREALLRTLEEAAMIGRAGTSGLSPNLLRARKVRGYGTDFTRAVASYINRAANDMAKAEVMPKVEDALFQLNRQIGFRANSEGHTQRKAYYEELKNRLLNSSEISGAARHPMIHRILQATALDKLFGVSFHVVNATEAPIIGGAVLGGRHGFGQAYASMGQIYKMMGVGGLLKDSVKDTFRVRNVFAKASDYPGTIRDNLSKTEEGRALLPALDHLVERGLMTPEAEYFFKQESAPKEGRYGQLMSTADRMARQMTQAVETVNRTVIGLSAYKMEKAKLLKKMSAEEAEKAALDYAHDTVKETMGDYSNTNSGRIFGNESLGMALQFKKYAVKTYTLMGRMVGQAWKGDPDARRSFLGLIVLQGAAAGAMGLPFMEVAKQAYSAYNLAAGNDTDTDADFEYGLRSLAEWAHLKGVAQDSAVHGITRGLFGFDVGSRIGMDKMSGITLPHSSKKDDMTKWFGEMLGGASLSTVYEVAQGLGGLRDDLLKGPTKASEVANHAAQVIPMKFASDAVKAVAGYMEKPETARGYKRSEQTFSEAEAGWKLLGLRPAREAAESERRNIDYVQTQRQQHQRTEFERRWARAETGDQRAKLWGEIERWNATIPDHSARLTRAQLGEYVRDFKEKSKTSVLGQEVHKRDQWIVKRNQKLFGAQ